MTTPQGTYAFQGIGFNQNSGNTKDTPVTIAGCIMFAPDGNVSGMALMPNADGAIKGQWRVDGASVLVTMGVANLEQLELRCYFDQSGMCGTFARRDRGKQLVGTMMKAL